MMDILDQRLDEVRLKVAAAAAPKSRASKIMAAFEAYQAQNPIADQKSTQPAEPAREDGPQMKLAKKWGEEFRLARAGQAARQAHGSGADRLPRYVVPS
jgi:hypothetical protein